MVLDPIDGSYKLPDVGAGNLTFLLLSAEPSLELHGTF